MRSLSINLPLELFTGQAETPLPLCEPLERGIEGLLIEIRPQHITEVQLAVRQLPQQEIADPLFATGTDEKIWIHAGVQRQSRGETRFVERLGTERPRRRVPHATPGRLDDIPASAITDCHV